MKAVLSGDWVAEFEQGLAKYEIWRNYKHKKLNKEAQKNDIVKVLKSTFPKQTLYF